MRTVPAIAFAAASFAAPVLAGPINPPAGAVGPTMKSLDTIEPRTVLSAATTPGNATSVYRITVPGSYYLAGNVTVPAGKNGVVIECPGVTLDLSGFAITGVAGSLNGIADTGGAVSGVSVRSGTVRDMGQKGVTLTAGAGAGITGLSLTGCGGGVVAGEGAVIESCTATQMGTSAAFAVLFNAVVSRCTTVTGQGPGFHIYEGSTVKDCSSRDHADGFVLASESTAIDCTATLSSDDGFVTGSLCRVERCSAVNSGGDGIHAGARNRVIGCTVALNTGAGVRLDDLSATLAANSTVTGLFARGNGIGIACLDQNCTVTANRCVNNGVNYSIVANNYVGSIVTAPVSGAINGSSGGAGMGSADPNANFAN
ncbi:MAG TPA: right-handed parallel beta-helix repeat-containing protein [Phycisphaerales bacterium]|nr:right-handed parallel beta-helix repeat-containing protein [Phycisphaerales bacterium]